jgi:hypothetical protein
MPKLGCGQCGNVLRGGYHTEFDTLCDCGGRGHSAIPTAEKVRRCFARVDGNKTCMTFGPQPYAGEYHEAQFGISEAAELVAALQAHTPGLARLSIKQGGLPDFAAAVNAAPTNKPLAIDELDIECTAGHLPAFDLTRLTLLNVDVDERDAASGGDAIAAFLASLSAALRGGNLRALRLSASPSIVARMDGILRGAVGLKRLDLLSWAISAELIGAVRSISTLEHLTLSHDKTPYGAAAAAMWTANALNAVCLLVEQTTSLTTLDLRGNDASLADFWPALARSPHVRRVVVGVPDDDGVHLHLAGASTALRSLVLCDARSGFSWGAGLCCIWTRAPCNSHARAKCAVSGGGLRHPQTRKRQAAAQGSSLVAVCG